MMGQSRIIVSTKAANASPFGHSFTHSCERCSSKVKVCLPNTTPPCAVMSVDKLSSCRVSSALASLRPTFSCSRLPRVDMQSPQLLLIGVDKERTVGTAVPEARGLKALQSLDLGIELGAHLDKIAIDVGNYTV
jgi:hypothetical protein